MVDDNRRNVRIVTERAGRPKRRKRKSVTLEEFCSSTTMHGISDWYSAQGTTLKIFWASALLLALAISSYGVYSCLLEFYINPIVTTIAIVPAGKLQFPTVYICPSNFVNSSLFLYASKDAENLIDYFKAAWNVSEGIVASRKGVVEALAKEIWEDDLDDDRAREIVLEKTLVDYQNALLDVAYQTEQFVKECYFMSKPVNCTAVVDRFLDKDKGICFAVQLHDYQSVAALGFTILLDLNTEHYLGPQISDGITVRVDRNVSPLSYNDVLVSPGTRTKISLTATESRLISVSSFSKTPQVCINDRPLQVLNLTYTREICQFDCFQAVVRNVCKCFLAIDVRFIQANYYNDGKFCRAADYKDCVEAITTNKTIYSEFLSCSNTCHRSCSQWSFLPSISSQKMPSKTLLDYYASEKQSYYDDDQKLSVNTNLHETNDSITESKSIKPVNEWANIPLDARIDRWSDNLIMLDIAYSRLEYTKIQQSPAMTVNTLLSNIGGQCGLWLGASLVTVVQIFVYVCRLSIASCRGCFM